MTSRNSLSISGSFQVAIAARTAAEETLRQREEEINQLGQQWLQREQHLIHERDEARGWLAEILETSLRNQVGKVNS